MKTQQDLIALFKQVATEVDKREFRAKKGEKLPDLPPQVSLPEPPPMPKPPEPVRNPEPKPR